MKARFLRAFFVIDRFDSLCFFDLLAEKCSHLKKTSLISLTIVYCLCLDSRFDF